MCCSQRRVRGDFDLQFLEDRMSRLIKRQARSLQNQSLRKSDFIGTILKDFRMCRLTHRPVVERTYLDVDFSQPTSSHHDKFRINMQSNSEPQGSITGAPFPKPPTASKAHSRPRPAPRSVRSAVADPSTRARARSQAGPAPDSTGVAPPRLRAAPRASRMAFRPGPQGEREPLRHNLRPRGPFPPRPLWPCRQRRRGEGSVLTGRRQQCAC